MLILLLLEGSGLSSKSRPDEANIRYQQNYTTTSNESFWETRFCCYWNCLFDECLMVSLFVLPVKISLVLLTTPFPQGTNRYCWPTVGEGLACLDAQIVTFGGSIIILMIILIWRKKIFKCPDRIDVDFSHKKQHVMENRLHRLRLAMLLGPQNCQCLMSELMGYQSPRPQNK